MPFQLKKQSEDFAWNIKINRVITIPNKSDRKFLTRDKFRTVFDLSMKHICGITNNKVLIVNIFLSQYQIPQNKYRIQIMM